MRQTRLFLGEFMATIKQVQRQRLQQLLDCEQAILQGAQSYKIGNREITRANLKTVQDEISALIDGGITLEDEPLVNGRYKRAVFID